MITTDDIQDLHDRSSEDLRAIVAHAMGIHADRHGAEPTAEALHRIGYALTHHIEKRSPAWTGPQNAWRN